VLEKFAIPSTGARTRLSGGEIAGLVLICLLFVAGGLNNIRYSGFVGQDYGFHYSCMQQVLEDPARWFFMDVTSRPFTYWVAAACHRFTGGAYGIQLTSIIALLLGVAAINLLYLSLRSCVADVRLRLAGAAMLAFLPSIVVTTTVFAPDAFTLLPFALALWALLRAVEVSDRRQLFGFSALCAVALVVGNFVKFTFLLLPVALSIVLLLLGSVRGRAELKRYGAVALVALVPPLMVGGWLHAKARSALQDQPARHSFNWKGTGEMTVRSVILPRWADRELIRDAPTYWEPNDQPEAGSLRLLQHNRYSFPGLFHLGVFSDVLDYAHNAGEYEGGRRPEPQKRWAKISVRLGIVFSLLAIGAVVVTALRVILSVRNRSELPPDAVMMWAVAGATWFVPLVVQLPFVHHAYDWGYWLPRLFLPPIWAAGLLMLAWMDASLPRVRLVRHGVALLMCFQAFAGYASVWY
jgi:hypothetical protein